MFFIFQSLIDASILVKLYAPTVHANLRISCHPFYKG